MRPRCCAGTMAALSTTRMSCQPGNHRLAKIQKRRSLSLRRGRNCRRRSTSSCCRRQKFSATNAALDLQQQAAIAHAHHGNVGSSGHLLAQRSLAVIFRQPEQDCPQFCAVQVYRLPKNPASERTACPRLSATSRFQTLPLSAFTSRWPRSSSFVWAASFRCQALIRTPLVSYSLLPGS
jgi:hypothetical protein